MKVKQKFYPKHLPWVLFFLRPFKSSFRFITKLIGRYRNFLYTAFPHMHSHYQYSDTFFLKPRMNCIDAS